MTFYQTLTPYYDEIFPANPKQINFISSFIPKDSSLLDVGAGTGNVALALVKAGYKVTAMEPEESMAAKLADKTAAYESLQVNTLTMQQINKLAESYDGIYCIGNTLVHLQNIDEIKEFIVQSFAKLFENGKLMIQIVNYEKKDFSFPVLHKENFVFERSYRYEKNKLLFTANLTVNGISTSNTILLYPLTVNQLVPLLKEVGFKRIETYANFDKAPYTENAPALVITATK